MPSSDSVLNWVDESSDCSSLIHLTNDQQDRLSQQLDRYLESLEQGDPLDRDQLSREHPDLADALNAYLSKLDALYGAAMGTASDHDALGDLPRRSDGAITLGDFTIEREIGRGGMGIVYEAHQRSLDRKVALKVLPMASLLDTRQIARFKNEAHAAGLLQHPHIVPVYSVGEQGGVHYFAMQLIDGVAMDQWVQDRLGQPIDSPCASVSDASWRDIVRWAIQIAGALQVAHESGVVHRDVKPSNLMLDGHGKIWITDFGLARCQSDVSLTRSGDVIGTMRYMSPEQTRGQSALIDGRSDVYSLAVALYEMLTLQVAFAGDDAPAILSRIQRQEISPLRKCRGDLPRDLETVIGKAMAFERSDRYETAAEFGDDLQRVLDHRPTIARPPTAIDRVARYAVKHHRAALAIVAVVLLGAIGLVVAMANLTKAKQISDANAIRAAHNERFARGAIDRLGSQMAELLADIPAAAAVRKKLLSETLAYYQSLAAKAGDDPDLRQDLAITLGKSGLLQAELGDHASAIDSLMRSEGLYAKLVARDPASVRLRLDWSTAKNNLAQTYQRAGKLIAAADTLAQAIQMQREIVQRGPRLQSQPSDSSGELDDPVHADAALALATSLNNLGLLLMQNQSTQEARATFLEAIDLVKPVAGKTLAPRGDDRQFDGKRKVAWRANEQLASLQSNLSSLLTKSEPEQAVQYARDSLQARIAALQQDRGNANLASQTVVTLNTLGAAQCAAKQFSDAIASFNRAQDIGHQLLSRWPDHLTYQRDLVLTHNHLGLAYSKLGQLAKACDEFDRAIELGRPLAAQVADDPETQSMLGGVLNNLGFLRQQLKQYPQAAWAYQEAIAHQTNATELVPENTQYQKYVKKHQENFQLLLVEIKRSESVDASSATSATQPDAITRLMP